MVQVTKQVIQQWVLIDYMAQKHRFQSTIHQMKRKYGMTLPEFEKSSQLADQEVVMHWDDSSDWSAAVDMLADIVRSIDEIRRGAFEMIE